MHNTVNFDVHRNCPGNCYDGGSDSVSLGGGPSPCMSNKLPGDTSAAVWGSHTEQQGHRALYEIIIEIKGDYY